MFSLLFRFPLAAVPRRRCRRSRTPPARRLTFGERLWLGAFAIIGLTALAGTAFTAPGSLGGDVVFDLFLLAFGGGLAVTLYVLLTREEDDEPDEPEPPMPVLHERIRPPNRQLPRDGRPPHRPYTGEFDLGDD